MRIRSIVIALLLLSLFSTAAGAIYIEGQPIPDDGLVHIMSASAGVDTGTASPVKIPYSTARSIMPATMSSYPASAGSIPMPATAPDLAFLTGGSGVTWLSGTGSPGSVSPGFPGTGSYSVPAVDLPLPDSNGNIVIGDTIGHIVAPPTPGYWDNLQDKDLHTNMPVISMPAMFGL